MLLHSVRSTSNNREDLLCHVIFLKERQSGRNNYNIITSVVMFHVSLRFRWEIIVVKRFMTFLLPQLGQIDS